MAKPARTTLAAGSGALAARQIHLLPTAHGRARARRLVAQHHDLGEVRAVGEQLVYALTDGHGDWLGVLVGCAAAGCPAASTTAASCGCRTRPFPLSARAPCASRSTGSAPTVC